MADAPRPRGASVAFEEVTVSAGDSVLLEGVSARVPAGGCTAIVGPNGAGKTTLLLSLLGERAHGGRIRLEGPEPGRPPRIGYVPQSLHFDRAMPLTVLEFMALAWQRSPLCFGVRRAHRERALDLLSLVHVDALHGRRLGALSGGELQRVLLAQAIGQAPELLVLDEPASGVDIRGGQVFCELLEGLRRERGFTLLMVSHDLPTVTHHATHVICLNRRVVAEGPPREVLTTEHLSALFGLHMGLVDRRAIAGSRGSCSASCCAGSSEDA